MPVRVTYAHKKRRRNTTKNLLSSPLEVLPTDMVDIPRTQMVRRMLKRSRRVALAEQLQDKNTEHLREHVAKRIKHSQDHVSRFETPFSSPQPAVAQLPEQEQLSPVPRANLRTMGRTTSRKLKENDPTSSRTLDSPFNSRPGSTTSSPRKHKGSRAHLSRRGLRYMRHKLEHTPSDTPFRASDDDASPGGPVQPQTSFYTAHSFGSESPRGSIHSHESFYTAQPRSVSTPAIPRVRKTRSPPGRTTAGSFIAEYETPLADMGYSPASSAATKMLSVPKVSVGDLDFPGTSPVQGQAVLFRTCKRSRALTPALPSRPSSPASDLAQELGSMDIGGDLDTQSDSNARHSSAPMPLLPRAHSLHDGLTNTNSVPRTAVKRRPARKRAGTVRASDVVKPSSGGAPGASISARSHVRRTRSGTVVGPNSRLAAKGAGPSLAAVPSGSESESDDELLLKSAWIEDMVYLGLSKPVKDVEADELNLSGPFSCRSGLRRR